MANSERVSPEQQEEIITGHLRTLADIIRYFGVTSVLVGGIPTEIRLGGNLKMIRANHTRRDVDALGLGPDKETIDTCNLVIAAEAQRPFFPPVGLEPVCFDNHPPKDHPWSMLSGVRRGPDGEFYIYYGSVEERIPAVTMTPVPINIKGIEFKTLPKRTLRARFDIRNCTPKPKDGEKTKKLDALIAANPDGEPGPENYDAYQRLIERVREKYPERVEFCRRYWEFDYKVLNGGLSGAVWAQGFIQLFRKS